MNEYCTLSQLLSAVKEGVEDLFPESLWVKAEIREWSPRANGHCYLTLSESADGRQVAEARAVIWKWNYLPLVKFFSEMAGEPLRAGITVLMRVSVNFSPMYGLSLHVEDVDPAFTVGERALERKKTVEKLAAGGYLEMQKELALPELPCRLAVISSSTAAGLRDFLRHLDDNPWGYKVETELFEARMQGEEAPASISAAISAVGDSGFDAVLILRGGGSETDLSCFDDYDLAVAVALCPMPVLTAIGHEKDNHVVDEVACVSVKTPTALADFILDRFARAEARLDELASVVKAAVLDRLSGLSRACDAAVSKLKSAFAARLALETSALDVKEAVISSNDPRRILSLGYALVTGPSGRLMRSSSEAKRGDAIGIRFPDGSVRAVVEDVEPAP